MTSLSLSTFYIRFLAQRVKGLPTLWETGFDPWVGKILWRRKWQLTPVLLPGKSHGRSLVGYSPWGRKESDTTEQLDLTSLHLVPKPSILPLVSLEDGFCPSGRPGVLTYCIHSFLQVMTLIHLHVSITCRAFERY